MRRANSPKEARESPAEALDRTARRKLFQSVRELDHCRLICSHFLMGLQELHPDRLTVYLGVRRPNLRPLAPGNQARVFSLPLGCFLICGKLCEEWSVVPCNPRLSEFQVGL